MNTTPEFRLFCLALRRRGGAEEREALRAAAAARPDWTVIVAGSRRHSVAGLLLAGLRPCADEIPGAVTAELRRLARRATGRSLRQITELRRLLPQFTAAGLPVLVVKGIALSAQLYGDPVLRDARDIDLLPDPERFDEAAAILEAAGYRRSGTSLSPRQSLAYRRWIKDVEFVDAGSGTVIELHQRLSDDPALLPADFAALWRDRDTVVTAGVPVETLSRRDLPLYLCAHGAMHAWERLLWLVDFAASLPDTAAADAALRAATTAGLAPAMAHAVVLARDWLAAPVADDTVRTARADRRVGRLDRILAHSYAGDAWHVAPPQASLAGLWRYSLWQRLYRLSLKSGWRYPARQAIRELFSPADWGTLPLPDRLFWLYPAVRPFGWLARRLGRL